MRGLPGIVATSLLAICSSSTCHRSRAERAEPDVGTQPSAPPEPEVGTRPSAPPEPGQGADAGPAGSGRPDGVALAVCAEAVPLPTGRLEVDLAAGRHVVDRDWCSRCAELGCVGSPAALYRIDVPAATRLRVETGFSAGGVLRITRGCGPAVEEIVCDAFGEDFPVWSDAVGPGAFYVAVAAERGSLARPSLHAWLEPEDLLERSCAAAPVVVPGRTVRGTTADQPDLFRYSSAAYPYGADVVYRLRVDAPARVTLRLRAEWDQAVLAVLRACDRRATAPLAYAEGAEEDVDGDSVPDRAAEVTTTVRLEAGTYYVAMGSYFRDGPYSLLVESVPAP